jgi:hypothetical protein
MAYSVGRRVRSLTAYFTSDSRLEQLKEWARDYNGLVDYDDFVEELESNIATNSKWLNSTAPALCNFVHSTGGDGSG